MRRLTLLLLILGALALSGAAYATEYHVGAGQQYATVGALLTAVTLVSNDIVWVHPGTYPIFWVKTGGGSSEATAVQIRAYDMNNKPVFDAAGGTNCIDFEDPTTAKVLVGKWFLIDGLEVKNAASRGVFYVATNLVMRHCYVHNNYNGMMGGNHNCRTAALGFSPSEEGNLTAEYNEFTQNGSGSMYHQIYAQSVLTQFRYNWVHDETGGSGWKDRSTNSLLEYDWIEQGPLGNYTLEIGGPDDRSMPDTPAYITLTGCVVTKNAGNNVWLFLENTRSLQGASHGQNLGYMYLYNNSFYSEAHTGPMLAGDPGSRITAHNNIFHSTTCIKMLDKITGAKNPGTISTSYNNWVKNTIVLASGFVNTVTGTSPGWVNTAWHNGDFHLTAGSQCLNSGNGSVPVLPTKQYLAPCNWQTRPVNGTIDIGAYEY